MTWVIGASSLFGYGVMLSDIRVRFPSGRTADIVKKAYPVGPFIVAGFAGSVLIGFKLLESLREYLVLPPEAVGQNNAWKPQWVGDNWGPMAKGLFDASPAREKRQGSQILLVGVSPDEDIGAPEFRRVYIIRFSNPGFQSGFVRKAFTVCHIGSGGGVDRYKRAIRQHFRLNASSLRAELGGPGGWAQMLGHTVDLIAVEHPVDGVSPHVHIVVCRLGGFLEGNNDRRSYPSDGSSPIEFRMPDVATDYGEFLRKCQGIGTGAEGAIC
jgi:hypothetical protein